MRTPPDPSGPTPVVDANHDPLGTLDEAENAPHGLRVRLTPVAKARLGTDQDHVQIPYDDVLGIRRDRIRVRKSTAQLADRVTTRTEPKDEDPLTVHAW